VAADAQLAASKMSGPQKAAVVLLAMGTEATAEVFKHLSEREIEALAREMTALGQVPVAETEKIVEEFHSTALAASSMIRGDEDIARSMLVKTLGTDSGRKIFDRVQRSVSSASFAALHKVDPQQLSKFVLGEHPQTIALILAHMKPSNAAQLVASLPGEMRVDVLTRMAGIEEISPDVMARIASIVEQRLKVLGGPSREQKGGIRAVATLFAHLERTVSGPALNAIEAQKPELALTIRNLMFVFEDLVRVDENGIREIVGQVDKKVLTLALKGSSEEVRKKFFDNMSKRAAEMMKEDMEALGAVRLRDVEKAQQEVVAVARRLEEEGVISTGDSVEDAYVR
jgi:flagellar motor switch protein FliG